MKAWSHEELSEKHIAVCESRRLLAEEHDVTVDQRDELLKLVKSFLGYANIQNHGSVQAVQLRDWAERVIALCEKAGPA